MALDDIEKSEEILEMGEFQKAHPIGYVNNYGKQKQSNGEWKYVGRNLAGTVQPMADGSDGRGGIPAGANAAAAGTAAANRPAESPAAASRGPVEDHTHLLKDVETIARSTNTQQQKMKELVDIGIHDVGAVATISGVERSEVAGYFVTNNIEPKASSVNASQYQGLMPKVDVKARWGSYKAMLDMVAKGDGKSLIAYGTGGVGKTYNMKQVFDRRGLKEFKDGDLPGFGDYDYVKITGKSTPTAMFKALYEHNGKTVVFDDCDSVLKDDTSINILKGALDTTGDGTISYLSGRPMRDSDGEEMPQRFAFVGRAVFISNLTPQEMPQPLRSRSFTCDLSMTPDETMTMLKEIAPIMPFQNNRGEVITVNQEDRMAAVDFLDQYKYQTNADNLNARTLGSIALIKRHIESSPDAGISWKDAAITLLG